MLKGLLTTIIIGLVSVLNAQQQVLNPEIFICISPDSVELVADVYFPETEKPYPVVLIRTPYNKDQYGEYGLWFAEKGYATVVQDVRGRWASGEEFYPFISETDDGLATLDCISAQSWCNGNIGMFGESYPGYCGLTLAASNHHALKTVFHISGWIEPHLIARPGGANHMMLNIPWLLNEHMQNTGQIVDFEIDELFNYLPQKDVFKSLGIQMEVWERPDEMQSYNMSYPYDKVKIPIAHYAGWYDFVGAASLDNYLHIEKQRAGPQRLVIGPWFHGQIQTKLTDLNEFDFGKKGVWGFDRLMNDAIAWFDRWLKIDSDKNPTEDSVKYFVLFENDWKTSSVWPPDEIRMDTIFLQSNGKANSRFGDGKLVSTTIEEGLSDSFVFDPYAPVPTNGGANFHFFPEQMGIIDQSKLEERKDILVYTSDSFPSKTLVTGPVSLELFASSDKVDTDFTAKLILVDTLNRAWNLIDGIVRARFRNGLGREELIEPGKVYKYTIELGHIAFAIHQREKLRLEVSSSNFPKYDRNPNSSESSVEAKILQTANQTVFHSQRYPSRLNLPILEIKSKS